MKVVSGLSNKTKDAYYKEISEVVIDRAVYPRFDLIPIATLGTRLGDDEYSIKNFTDAMERVNNGTGTMNDIALNEAVGQLGLTAYYPHPDNTYHDELMFKK